MRRKDREVKDINEIIKIINQCEVIRIAMTDNGIPYIIPLNFGHEISQDELIFYFHSAAQGRKIDILKNSPYVCFELDCSFNLIRDESACMWSAEYESVIGYGYLSILQEEAEKHHAMDTIMQHYGYTGTPEYTPAVFDRTLFIKLEVEQITAKRNVR